VCVNGVVGFAGLEVTLATLHAGRRLALANKESLTMAGELVMREVRLHRARALLQRDLAPRLKGFAPKRGGLFGWGK